MQRQTLKGSSQDDYLELVRKFPLKRLRSDAEHRAALEVSGNLLGLARRLMAGESQYLDALVVLIRDYESTNQHPAPTKASGMDTLRHLLAEHQMTQRSFAKALGLGESAASMILSGHRELTKTHIQKLSRLFGVGVAAFF